MGVGQCAVIAPEVFDQGEQDALVVLLDASPPHELHGAIRDAALSCPSATIAVHEN
jgi:ferredoxin